MVWSMDMRNHIQIVFRWVVLQELHGMSLKTKEGALLLSWFVNFIGYISIVQNFHFSMTYRIIQIQRVQLIQSWMIFSTFQFYTEETRHISFHPHFEDLCGSQIIHFKKYGIVYRHLAVVWVWCFQYSQHTTSPSVTPPAVLPTVVSSLIILQARLSVEIWYQLA